ncbi:MULTISPECIES: DUF4089 domain-containing protein [unclassified Roseitalea]|uniref:DUF4089 domain-containing protein n=1 Tax=unclassified Roseitalea TaxID=2639107 RepID=UPI00273D7586|nr:MULTISPECIES: DUF4089 domain-containing protein [unclassified Roseitalea]
MSGHGRTEFDSDGLDALAFVRAAAPAIGLALTEDDIAAVAAQFERAAGFARIVDKAVPELDKVSPAPVFAPARQDERGSP